MEEGDFTMVKRGSKRCARPRKGSASRGSYKPSSSAAHDAESFAVEDVLKGVSESVVTLRNSSWVQSLHDLVLGHSAALSSETQQEEAHVGTPRAAAEICTEQEQASGRDVWCYDLVCYGLGHIGGNRTAQLQAALALCLRDELRISGEMFLFDPVLTDNEKEGARRLGFTVSEVNEVGLHTVSAPTLFYMPHCGRRLYSNVLRANWGLDSLQNVIILGNSFSSYRLRPLSGPAAGSCLIAALDAAVLETPLPPCPQSQESFADMSVHSFPRQVLATLGQESKVWEEMAPDAGGDDHGWC